MNTKQDTSTGAKEEIRKKIRNYFQVNKNENTKY
jgi:hypothetical protein